MTRRPNLAAGLALLIGLFVWASAPAALGASARRQLPAQKNDLPARLTDREFWKLVDTFSEANGYFQSDNLVSNEDTFQYVIPELLRIIPPGGAYLGVGPDQNFTYLVALKPRIAFITDIRRGNLQEQLMYKALLELSADRAEFLSRLFSRKRPSGLSASSTSAELFEAYLNVPMATSLRDENLKAMLDRLGRSRGSPVSDDDAAGIAYVYDNFVRQGPTLSYAMNNLGRIGPMRYPSYQDLQMQTDGQGVSRGYLASEANFTVLKTMEQDNRIVPVVGDFAGTKALRSVGAYLAEHGATVSIFYTSNVEQYLFQNDVWPAFARNVATLPLDDSSTFIRSCFNSCGMPNGSRAVSLLDSISGLLRDFNEGRIQNYWQVLQHSR
jgi:hypothetical protein